MVDFAVQKFVETRAYEKVFAVFDRDEHATYNDALKRARQLDGTLRNDDRRPVEFRAIASVPCFELWLLLHFEDVHAFGQRAEMIAKLKKHIPDYEKGATNIYALTEQRIDEAKGRAAQLKGRFTADDGTDPYTDIHDLVDLLRAIRAQP